MRTPAQIAGHPIHPMIIPIPIGLWLFSLVCDLIALRAADATTWHTASLYAMVGGVIGAVVAAVPGLIDLVSLHGRPIQRTGLKHMGLNLLIAVLFAVNAWMRHDASISVAASLWLSIISILLLLVSGWLGGKMVYEAGVAVNAEEAAATRRTDAWRPAGAAARATGTDAMMGRERAMAADTLRPSRDEAERAASRPSNTDFGER